MMRDKFARIRSLTLISLLTINLSTQAFSQDTAGPSFDCNDAKLPVEIAICSDPYLSKLDYTIGQGFSFLKENMGSDFARSLAKPLMEKRNECASDTNCIKNSIISAINIFAAVGAPITVPDDDESSTLSGSSSTTSQGEDTANDVQIVESEGLGATPNEAVQNAAQNGLIEVVGAYLDTSTTLEERTAVEEDLRKRTSTLDVKISQYSQGSIESIEILKLDQNDSGYHAVVKMGIRNQALREQVRTAVKGTAEIGASMFAQVKTATENSSAAADILLNKIIEPAAKWEGAKISIGQPELRTGDWYDFQTIILTELRSSVTADNNTPYDFENSFSYAVNNIDSICGFNEMNFLTIPIKVEMSEGYISSTKETIESLSSGTLKTEENCPQGSVCLKILGESDTFVIPSRDKLEKLMENFKGFATKLEIIGEGDSEVWSDVATYNTNCQSDGGGSGLENQFGFLLAGSSINELHRLMSYEPSLVLIEGPYITILPQLNGYLFYRPSQSVLKIAKSLNIFRVPN